MTEPRSLGAAELLRSVGLLADGPVRWSNPVRVGGPGVYLVELAGPHKSAPIDHMLVAHWIERVPTLTLDGARPTQRELAVRMGEFWLPDETVLYIGMTNLSIGGRVGALVKTELGDRRPHSAGHWLKTLTVLPDLRVWWASTAAPEEYEDALLSAFAQGVSPAATAALRDSSVILPWANLQSATDERKAARDQGRTPGRRGGRARLEGRAAGRRRIGTEWDDHRRQAVGGRSHPPDGRPPLKHDSTAQLDAPRRDRQPGRRGGDQGRRPAGRPGRPALCRGAHRPSGRAR